MIEYFVPKAVTFYGVRSLISLAYTTFKDSCFVQLSVMVAYSLRVVASIARYGQWVLANAACIIGVAFRNTMLLTQVLGYVAISLLYRNLQLFKQAFHKCLTHAFF